MQKHLEFYKQCMQTGYMPNEWHGFGTGLCGAADHQQIDKDILNLFSPTKEDMYRLWDHGLSTGWWGYEGDAWDYASWPERSFGFTTLRQTIVLFMAAINDEL
jgi:hypothetical protein